MIVQITLAARQFIYGYKIETETMQIIYLVSFNIGCLYNKEVQCIYLLIHANWHN